MNCVKECDYIVLPYLHHFNEAQRKIRQMQTSRRNSGDTYFILEFFYTLLCALCF